VNNMKWSLRRKSENGKEERNGTGTVGEEEIMKTMIGREGGRKIEGMIEEATDTEIVIEKGGGMMTARMKRNAVTVRRRRDGDANVMTTNMTASAQDAMRRTVTDVGIGVANTGGDDVFSEGLYQGKLLISANGILRSSAWRNCIELEKLPRAD
jgi:hypothetical protein